MQMLYSDKPAHRPGDSFRLILLHRGGHVVANGSLFQVRMLKKAGG